jgi:hypothetical protein
MKDIIHVPPVLCSLTELCDGVCDAVMIIYEDMLCRVWDKLYSDEMCAASAVEATLSIVVVLCIKNLKLISHIKNIN